MVSIPKLSNQQINEEQPQQDLDAQHSLPDLEGVNIKLENDEKKVNYISNDSATVPEQIQPQQSPQLQEIVIVRGSVSFASQLFHCIFKGTAILFYFILNMLIGNSTITFVIIVLLNAFDFWTVKNVTGRKLVGLRWYSEIMDDGTEVWRYESKDASFEPNEFNSQVFWFVQLISVIVWFILSFMYIIGMSWFWGILALTGFIFTGLNLLGFYKCRGAHQKKAKEYMAKIGLKAMQKAM